ncbi:MAG TPA: cob(I)yrinic acid a,c-diamide adenosyltransferase, partial [Chthoniobacterales bacterium]|nr:cob(I)yrinic acid a,c-diamide adenosyltransferase [Chthoniobacterales bacterium]
FRFGMSIATKTGDEGETSLMYGRRVPKTDPRVDAYGCVDELNAALGLARASASSPFLTEEILGVQKELIVVMGELATAREDLDRYSRDGFQSTSSTMTARLTASVDDLEKNKLGKFKDWSIPGNTMNSAALDLARTICRRAERRVAALMDAEAGFNREILRYLNRLSDLCWLLARYAEQLPGDFDSPEGKR